MSRLFEKTEINNMQLNNRFVRSATWEGMAGDDGECTPQLMKTMTDLAQGSVGLIITSHSYIRKDGQARPRQIGIHKDHVIDGYQTMTREVHKHGSKIAIQINHVGIFGEEEITGHKPLAPSKVDGEWQSPQEITNEGIGDLIRAFGQAARRAKEADFDAVQIHCAHGYINNQFLSPLFNKRKDEYGGSIENRARIVLEVLREIRSVVGVDYPVLVKINSEDFVEGGLIFEDSIKICQMLEKEGIDAIELSGGTMLSGKMGPAREGIHSAEKEAYFKESAKILKDKLDVPLILVGGIRSLEMMERLLDEGYADYISMSRPFIREPGLVKRWQSGDRKKATCLSDNLCRGPLTAGEGIYCVVEQKIQDSKKG